MFEFTLLFNYIILKTKYYKIMHLTLWLMISKVAWWFHSILHAASYSTKSEFSIYFVSFPWFFFFTSAKQDMFFCYLCPFVKFVSRVSQKLLWGMGLGPEQTPLTLSAHLDKWMDTGIVFSLSLKVFFFFFFFKCFSQLLRECCMKIWRIYVAVSTMWCWPYI